jgi:hypothetical protein
MRGRPIRLSPSRRLIGDLLHAAKAVPTVPVQRRMNLAAVVAARAALADRPSWTAVFTKAYAQVCAHTPELRRAYVKLPWPHLYEYPDPVASVAVERDHAGEKAVFFARVRRPDHMTLADLTHTLRHFRDAPVRECKGYRQSLVISRLPWPVRRGLWAVGLNLGRLRGNFFGTFAVSVYSGLGAESLHPLSPVTTTLNYGVLGRDGSLDVRLVYDHRVLDGAAIARALADLEATLTGDVLAELRAPSVPTSRAA